MTFICIIMCDSVAIASFFFLSVLSLRTQTPSSRPCSWAARMSIYYSYVYLLENIRKLWLYAISVGYANKANMLCLCTQSSNASTVLIHFAV